MSGMNGVGGPTAAQNPFATNAAESRPSPSSDASLFPEPRDINLPSGMDAGAQLAALLIAVGYDQRKFARDARAKEERAQEAAEDREVAAKREKAGETYASGLAEGFTSIASGIVTVAGAGEIARKDAPQPADGSRAKQGWDATDKFVEGTGKLIGVTHKARAEELDADATQAEHVGAHHKRAAEDAKSAVDDASKLIDKAIDFYREYQTARSDAQKAAILRA